MKEEEKQLLLQDLCGRLPYGVKCYAYQYKIDGNDCECCGILTGINNGYFYLSDRVSVNGGKTYDERYLEVKPYLRPMSSMTEDEKKEYNKTCIAIFIKAGPGYKYDGWWEHYDTITSFDWLNKNHFDYRDLIQMELAIAVTKENNPYKEKL